MADSKLVDGLLLPGGHRAPRRDTLTGPQRGELLGSVGGVIELAELIGAAGDVLEAVTGGEKLVEVGIELVERAEVFARLGLGEPGGMSEVGGVLPARPDIGRPLRGPSGVARQRRGRGRCLRPLRRRRRGRSRLATPLSGTGDEVAHPARHFHQREEPGLRRHVHRAGEPRKPRPVHAPVVLALVMRRRQLHNHHVGGARPRTLLHTHQPMHPQVQRHRHPHAPAHRKVVGDRRDHRRAAVPALPHVPGQQHGVVVPGVHLERAAHRCVEMRHHRGKLAPGVLAQPPVHPHPVAPRHDVRAGARAGGLDALGLAAALRIAVNELTDGLGAHSIAMGSDRGAKSENGVLHNPASGTVPTGPSRHTSGAHATAVPAHSGTGWVIGSSPRVRLLGHGDTRPSHGAPLAVAAPQRAVRIETTHDFAGGHALSFATRGAGTGESG